MDKFDPGSSRTITITEGELDAISLWQVTKTPVVSVSSATSSLRDCTVARDWLLGFDRIILAFDNDPAGREAVRRVAQLFEFGKVFDLRLIKHKDANAYVEAGEEDELKTAWTNCKKYVPDNFITSLADFSALLSEEPRFGVPYPFPTLTEMTYGIRPGEIVLITAQEGVGKTSILHTIQHRLLKETTANVGCIYPEETPRRHLEAILGIEVGKPIHIPGSGVTGIEKSLALEKLLEKDGRLLLYNYSGGGDPDLFLDVLRFMVAGALCKFVCFDLVGMVIGDSGTDDRKAIDYFMTRLGMMVVELDFAAIITSHVNDSGQTRGSRYVGKAASTRIDLERNLSAGSTRTILTVSKNRYASRTGYAGTIEFDPLTYTFKEIPQSQLDAEFNVELSKLVKGIIVSNDITVDKKRNGTDLAT
jgi:twinkle protein